MACFVKKIITLIIAVPALLLFVNSAFAADPQRSFINGSFEIPDLITPGCRVYINADLVPGWETTHPNATTQAVGCPPGFDTGVTGPIIELWKTPRQYVNARDGDQLAELNALVPSRLLQKMCIYNGETVRWALSHRGRGSATVPDVMNFLVNSQTIKRMRTTNTGVGDIDSTIPGIGSATSTLGPNGWRDYSGSFTFSGTDGIQNLGFETVSSGSYPDEGNFLDAISISVNPLVEFSEASFTSDEGDGTGKPTISVLGIVPTGGLSVEVKITGGTATLGSDFQTVPPDSTTIFVTVPAGEYLTATTFPLPVVPLFDSEQENDETVLFQIQTGSLYTTGDTAACSSNKIAETTWTIRDVPPFLTIAKSAHLNGSGIATLGDTITYSFLVTNVGSSTLTNVTVNDPFLTAAGVAITPGPQTLAAGANVTFTATYTLTQADIDAGEVTNTATAQGTLPVGTVVTSASDTATVLTGANGATAYDVSLVKQALLSRVRRGEQVPYAVRVTNNTDRNIGSITVVDTLPSGFRYVDGSATVGGSPFTPIVNGLQIRFENISLGPRADVLIRLQATVLSSVGPGKYTNRANVYDSAGRPLAPEARADIEIQVEPVFDCGDIIGRVFDDKNRNGYPDDGESGLPGVKVATVKGELITTDQYGRFHVACADLPDQRIGSNFILKLDPRTLPAGYRVTTENPRVVRLTAGKMTTINFGAALGRVVRLDVRDDAFQAGKRQLDPQWEQGVDRLIAELKKEQSTLRITYLNVRTHKDERHQELVKDRIDALRNLIVEQWRKSGDAYPLDIEIRTETTQ